MVTLPRPNARNFVTSTLKQVPCISAAGQLAVDWQHPLARGLIGAYLPGVTIHDITGINGPLVPVATKAAVKATPEGPSFGNSGTKNASSANTAVGTMDPRLYTGCTTLSSYARIFQSASTASSGQNWLFYLDDGTHSPAGFDAVLSTDASNLYAPFCGSFNSGGTNATVAVNAVHGLLCTNTSGSSAQFYVDGVSATTATLTLTNATGSSTRIEMNGCSDASILAIYFWSRILTAAEAVSLEADPYGIFLPSISNFFPLSQGTLAPNWIMNPDVIAPQEIWF